MLKNIKLDKHTRIVGNMPQNPVIVLKQS